ncbi:MAG: hypothetical protein ACOYK9_02370 [Chlamydiia bacterium]
MKVEETQPAEPETRKRSYSSENVSAGFKEILEKSLTPPSDGHPAKQRKITQHTTLPAQLKEAFGQYIEAAPHLTPSQVEELECHLKECEQWIQVIRKNLLQKVSSSKSSNLSDLIQRLLNLK